MKKNVYDAATGKFTEVDMTVAEIAALVAVEESKPTAEMVRAECARRMSALVALYSTEERETWPIQVSEAQAVMAGRAGEAIMLPTLAAARNVPLQAFAAVVIQTANATKTATAKLLAAQARLLALPETPADYADDKWWD